MNGFGAFWLAYPRREAKLDAMKAYAKALTQASADEILAGVERYKLTMPDEKRYQPLPASWLRAGRWMDEYDEPVVRPVWTPCEHTPPCPSKAWCAVLRDREKAS
jgi:hypothetical protein